MRIDLVPYYYPGCEKHYEPSGFCFLIDVFRASSMMVTLAHKGAERVYLTEEVALARDCKRRYPEILLFGEREGVPPPGFDGGNSPAELEGRSLKGKTVVLTTTNGTRAGIGFRTKTGRIGALSSINLGAGLAWVERNFLSDPVRENGITILCSGSQNQLSVEDFCVGALFWYSLKKHDEAPDSEVKVLAEAMARRARDQTEMRKILFDTSHARTLKALGYHKDIEWILSRYDHFSILPEVSILETATIM